MGSDEGLNHPLLNHPTSPPITCSRCGGIFEGPIRLDGGLVIPGHVAGDPRTCVPRGRLKGRERDARVRRAAREGR